MPVWTPGSYLIREYQRHLQDFSATDAAGQRLQWEKTNKNTWRVLTNGERNWHATSNLCERTLGQDKRTQFKPRLLDQRRASDVPGRPSE